MTMLNVPQNTLKSRCWRITGPGRIIVYTFFFPQKCPLFSCRIITFYQILLNNRCFKYFLHSAFMWHYLKSVKLMEAASSIDVHKKKS